MARFRRRRQTMIAPVASARIHPPAGYISSGVARQIESPLAFKRLTDSPPEFLKGVVSDGIIAPGYDPPAVEVLKSKKQGSFIVIEAGNAFTAPERERRELFGMELVQDRNHYEVTEPDLAGVVWGTLTPESIQDLLLGLIAIKYAQSNSVGYAFGGQMIGIGAGQQSRVDCTKLAGAKADLWWLRTHPKVLGLHFKTGVKRQDRINGRTRYIEGDLLPHEEQWLCDALDSPYEPLRDDERSEWLKRMSGRANMAFRT